MGSFDYRGPYAYHVILLTQARAPRFTDRSLGRRCIERLRQTADHLGFRLLAFCFMPSHLHTLVLGRDDNADLIRFVQRFKQVTSFHFKRESGLRLWQQSFYDRVLRVEEDLAGVAAYVLGNPVRSGLGTEASEWPLVGGEYAEVDEAADGAQAPSLRPDTGSCAAGGRHGQ
jgi:putative transposase